MNSIWNVIIPILSGFVTGIAGYIGGRRQRNTDIDSQTIENLDKSLLFYKNLLDDIEKRFNSELATLRQIIMRKETENIELRERLKKYEAI